MHTAYRVVQENIERVLQALTSDVTSSVLNGFSSLAFDIALDRVYSSHCSQHYSDGSINCDTKIFLYLCSATVLSKKCVLTRWTLGMILGLSWHLELLASGNISGHFGLLFWRVVLRRFVFKIVSINFLLFSYCHRLAVFCILVCTVSYTFHFFLYAPFTNFGRSVKSSQVVVCFQDQRWYESGI